MLKAIMIILVAVVGTYAQTIKAYETLKTGEKVVAKGVFVYSKPLHMYFEDKSPKKHKIVMAAKFFIKKTPKGYEGYMIRGLYDIEQKKLLRYYLNKRMIMHPPENTAIDLQDIAFKNKTVTFTLPPFGYVLTDGGEGFINDEAVVSFAKKTKTLELYGGDIEIIGDASAAR